MNNRLMRHIRVALLALAAFLAAPAALPAQDAPAPVEAAAASTAPQAAAAPSSAASLPRYTPPRTLRAYAHVFAAFAAAWLLMLGYIIFLARKFRRVEEQVEALARA